MGNWRADDMHGWKAIVPREVGDATFHYAKWPRGKKAGFHAGAVGSEIAASAGLGERRATCVVHGLSDIGTSATEALEKNVRICLRGRPEAPRKPDSNRKSRGSEFSAGRPKGHVTPEDAFCSGAPSLRPTPARIQLEDK